MILRQPGVKYSGCRSFTKNKERIIYTNHLHKPIIRKFEKRKIHSSFINNICGADLADVQ